MKTVLLILTVFLISVNGFSQNATLTKGETVEYIAKKFREFDGVYVYRLDSNKVINYIDDKYLSSPSVILSDGKITFSYSLSFRPFSNPNVSTWMCTFSATFKPADITYMNYSAKYQNLYIGLKNQTAKQVTYCSQWHKSSEKNDQQNFVVLHISGDEDAINKIIKALNHLKELLKAEDDPFGD